MNDFSFLRPLWESIEPMTILAYVNFTTFEKQNAAILHFLKNTWVLLKYY